VTREPDGFLLCRAGSRLCALPLADVAETMRPLPIDTLDGTPSFVAGVAVVRGAPVPVVDVRRLLGGAVHSAPAARFVTVRIGTRRIALAFDSVLGVRRFDAPADDGMPPLLQDAGAGVISAIRALDAELLVVLEAARAVPDTLWAALEATLGPS